MFPGSYYKRGGKSGNRGLQRVSRKLSTPAMTAGAKSRLEVTGQVPRNSDRGQVESVAKAGRSNERLRHLPDGITGES